MHLNVHEKLESFPFKPEIIYSRTNKIFLLYNIREEIGIDLRGREREFDNGDDQFPDEGDGRTARLRSPGCASYHRLYSQSSRTLVCVLFALMICVYESVSIVFSVVLDSCICLDVARSRLLRGSVCCGGFVCGESIRFL